MRTPTFKLATESGRLTAAYAAEWPADIYMFLTSEETVPTDWLHRTKAKTKTLIRATQQRLTFYRAQDARQGGRHVVDGQFHRTHSRNQPSRIVGAAVSQKKPPPMS